MVKVVSEDVYFMQISYASYEFKVYPSAHSLVGAKGEPTTHIGPPLTPNYTMLQTSIYRYISFFIKVLPDSKKDLVVIFSY